MIPFTIFTSQVDLLTLIKQYSRWWSQIKLTEYGGFCETKLTRMIS